MTSERTAGNFQFLQPISPQLEKLGTLAEHFFHADPSTSLIKLRQFSEILTQLHAAHAGLLPEPAETQSDLLRRLKFERAIPDKVLDVLHHIRKTGNSAVHEGSGDHRQALTALKMSVQLGIWHYRVVRGDAKFSPGPFVPPENPTSAAEELQQELDRLRRERDAALNDAQLAQKAAELAQREAETASDREQREKEERAQWEALAQEVEQDRSQLQRHLQDLQEKASAQPEDTRTEFVQAAQAASSTIDLDETATRDLIDQQLRDWGWEADSVNLRHSKGTRPAKKRSMAIAEWPTKSGPADYALFVGERCLGIVEAKRYRKNVSAAIDQSERYSMDFDHESTIGTWGVGYRVPFVFATNGRPYLKQIETESGIWFRDVRLCQRQSKSEPKGSAKCCHFGFGIISVKTSASIRAAALVI